MTEAGKKAAVLLLVRQVLSSVGEDSTGVGVAPPSRYEDLRDGAYLYRILARIAPHAFPDADEIAEQSVASRQNWVVRKGNLMALVRHMNDYAHQALGAPDTLNLMQIISAADIANSPALGDESLSQTEHDKGFTYLMELTDIFVVMVVLSGDATVLQALKTLPHADQVVLSNAAKACITKHALRPRRRNETPTMGDSRRSSVQRSVVSSHGGPSSRGTRPPPALVDEAAVSHNVQQLRRELDDAKAKVTELDSKLQLALSEKQDWESKYKKILAETEQRHAAFADEEHLRQLLAKKDEAVRSLTAAAEEHSKKIAAFKEATMMQESVLGSMKRKLRQTEEELVKKNSEKREALERLAVAEDKLAVQITARTDLEKKMEDLRTELALLKTQNQDGANDQDARFNHSFGSVNSVDCIVQLENELDEARSQKEAAERLLHVLQRQIALLPSEGLQPSAAMDALKAQMRQAEKEKEDLRNQLVTTIAKLEDAQNSSRRIGSHSAIDSESDSFAAGGKVSGKDADGASTQDGAESCIQQARLRENSNGLQREQTLLASTVLQLGYRNLILQQRALLASGSLHDVAGESVVGDGSSTKCAVAGSFLTRHRREVEEGLMESVLERSGWSRPPKLSAS